jgi:hypothetical protein
VISPTSGVSSSIVAPTCISIPKAVSYRSSAKLISAIWRARFTAVVNSR